MRSFFILAFLYCLIRQGAFQQIAIKSSITLAPQMIDDYNVVHTFIYPSSTKFDSQLDRDFFVKKLSQMKIAKPSQTQPSSATSESSQASTSIIFESVGKSNPIIPSEGRPVPQIKDIYHIVKIIYPFAQIEQPKIYNKPIEITFDTPQPVPSNQNLMNSQEKVNNQDKGIEWKVKNPQPLRNYVVENGKQTALTNLQIISEIEIGKPQPEDIPLREKSANENKQIDSNLQLTKSEPIKNHSPPPSPNSNKHTQNYQVQNPKSLTIDKQILQQIQTIKLKNHKVSIIILFLILVILLFIFLYMKWGKRNVQFLKKLNQKLKHYRSSALYVAPEEQEQGIAHKGTGMIQEGQY